VAQLRARATAVAAAVAVALAAAGCARSPAAEPDAGAGGDAGRDGSGSYSCPLNGTCDDVANAVRSCDKTGVGAVIDVCDAMTQRCSWGRCTSKSCATAEQTQSARGCLFYAVQSDNVDADDPLPTTLLLTNAEGDTANVTLEQRQGGAGADWVAVRTLSLDPGAADSLTLPAQHLEGPGKGLQLASRLISDTPITVVMIESDDSSETSTSSGGTMLLPAHTLGQNYMAATYPQSATPRVSAAAGSRGGAGQITIIGTQRQTSLSVRVANTASLAPSIDYPAAIGGQTIALSLDDGDIYQLLSANEGDDLSGTTISSDKPVAVFAGNVSTTYGEVATGISSADMALEQMLPMAAWSRNYVAAWLPPQAATCDSILGGPGVGLWRILASRDGTRVTFDAPPQLTGLPAGPISLNAGQVAELAVGGAGDFTVSATQPVLVTQGMDCEPTLSTAVTVDSSLDNLLFALPPNFDHELAIVRPTGGQVVLDGVPVKDALFAPAGKSYEVARVPIAACAGTAQRCIHRLSGTFGVTWRGMDVVCSYALTVPSWFQCNEPECL
jgi:hypothetical protein